MPERPSPAARRYFAWILATIIIGYAIFAIGLSVHVIDRQSGVRIDLYAALRALDRLHREALSQTTTDQERQSVETAWRNERAFAAASPIQARHIAQTLISHLNQQYPDNACGRKDPAFVATTALPARPACMIAVGTKGRIVQVTGYDTQGIAMDNFYEYLYAPVSPSD